MSETGAHEGAWKIADCGACEGGGTCPRCRGKRRSLLVLACTTCGGRGYCRRCRGTGEVVEVQAARPAGPWPGQEERPFKRFGAARRAAKRAARL